MLREATTAGHANAGAVRGSSGGHGRDRQRSDADAGQRAERWLVPVLSPEAIRLVAALGGTLGPELTAATRPDKAAGDLLERINRNTPARRPQGVPRLGPAALPRSSRALGRPVPRACRATSATAGAGYSTAGAGYSFIATGTPGATAGAAASSRCGSTCSPRASSPSADSASPRWRSATPSRAP
jgi:hypothetical protein